jgi:hypothetical protein
MQAPNADFADMPAERTLLAPAPALLAHDWDHSTMRLNKADNESRGKTPGAVATDEARFGCGRSSTGRRRTEAPHQRVFKCLGLESLGGEKGV